MSGKFRWESAVLGVLSFGLPRPSLAQGSEPGLTTVVPNVERSVPPAEAPRAEMASGASTHVFDAYRIHADSMESTRMASALGSFILGASFVGGGLLARERWNEDFGTVLLVAGGVTAGAGLLVLVLPTDVESVGKANGVGRVAKPSPEQEAALEQDWETLAGKARTARHIGAGISFVLSGAALVSGIVVMASDGIDEDTQRWLAPTLLITGGVAAAGGVASLMIETPTESSYEAFLATRGKRPRSTSSGASSLRLSAAPLPKGGWIGFATNF